MIAVLLRLAAASCEDGCESLREITIDNVTHLHSTVSECDTNLCGSDIIGTWNVSGIESFAVGQPGAKLGPFDGKSYEYLNLDGWKDQIGDKSLEGLFRNYMGSNVNIANWDVSHVTTMARMFASSSFNGNISKWDVSNVEVMEGMFAKSAFDRDISEWNVRSVTNLNLLFWDSNFSRDLSAWGNKLQRNTTINQSFLQTHVFFDLSDWPNFDFNAAAIKILYGLPSDYPDSCVPGSTEVCEIEFRDKVIYTFDELVASIDRCDSDLCGSELIGSWNVSGIESFAVGQPGAKMGPFVNKEYEYLNLDGWKDQIGDKSLEGLFRNYTGSNVNIANWDVSHVTDMRYMFVHSKFNGNISEWNVSNVEVMEGVFLGSSFNGDVSKWDVRNVKNMISMFMLSAFDRDISEWNVSSVTNLNLLFWKSNYSRDLSAWGNKLQRNAAVGESFLQTPVLFDFSDWPNPDGKDAAAIKIAYGLPSDYPDSCVPGSFTVCEIEFRDKVIHTVEELVASIDRCDSDLCGSELIGSWNMSRIDTFAVGSEDDLIGPFYGKAYEDLNLDGWKDQIGNKSLEGLFKGYMGSSVNIANWDVRHVTTMASMFASSSFNGDILEWNVSNVESMERMFSQSSFNGNISKWDVRNVKSMTLMFMSSAFDRDISEWGSKLQRNATLTQLFLNTSVQFDLSSWPNPGGKDAAAIKAAYGLPSDYPDSCVPGSFTVCEIGGRNTVIHTSAGSSDSDDSDFTIIIVAVTVVLLLLALIEYRYRFRERLAAASRPGELLL